eukprot:scaffold32997_cov101-Isochrysis_galbana.AAC.3
MEGDNFTTKLMTLGTSEGKSKERRLRRSLLRAPGPTVRSLGAQGTLAPARKEAAKAAADDSSGRRAMGGLKGALPPRPARPLPRAAPSPRFAPRPQAKPPTTCGWASRPRGWRRSIAFGTWWAPSGASS